MDKKQFIKELSKYTDTTKIKIKFFKVSPYMKKRYKPEFITWEAWLYNGKSATGYLTTGDDWNKNEASNRLIIDTFLH